MRLKNFVFFAGLHFYIVLVAVVHYILSTGDFGIYKASFVLYPISALVLLIIPGVITKSNRLRESWGHKDFGLLDSLGKRKITEHETKEYQEAAYPIIPDKYIATRPRDLILGKVGKKYVYCPITRDGLNSFILGGVGSGKSTLLLGFLYTVLYGTGFQTKKDSLHYNFFVVDIKGEIYEKLLKLDCKYRASPGNLIQVVQPSNRSSWGWDVLYRIHKPVCSTTEKLKACTDIADALVQETGDNPYFTDNARKILTGVLFFYIEKGLDFIPIIQKLTRTPLDQLLTEICDEAKQDNNGIVADKLMGFVGKDGNESLQDIEATLKTYLDVFSYPDVVWCLQLNPQKTSPAALDDGVTNLDLAIEQGMLRTYQPLFRLITMQVLRHCESDFHEGDNRNTVLIVDEASRVGKIPDLDGCMATLRSKSTGICLCFQNQHQFLDLYGDDLAATILGLCELKVFLSGDGDKETIEYVSTMAGEYKLEKRNYDKNGFAGAAMDVKYSDDFRKVVNAESLMELREKQEAIAFIFGRYYRFKKFRYFEDKYLKPISKEIAEYNKNNSMDNNTLAILGECSKSIFKEE